MGDLQLPDYGITEALEVASFAKPNRQAETDNCIRA
jgi:hypothetical protein